MSVPMTTSPCIRERSRPTQRTKGQPQSIEENWDDPIFNAFSSHMSELREQVKRVIPQDTTLLFTGETGTGKTRLARLIHELSPRRNAPFLVMDCDAVAPHVLESEMLGHIQGAFPGADRDRCGKFAAAGHGTLVLEAVNALPLP